MIKEESSGEINISSTIESTNLTDNTSPVQGEQKQRPGGHLKDSEEVKDSFL